MKAIIALFLVLAVASAEKHHFGSFVQNLLALTAKDEIEDVKKIIIEVRQELQNDLNELQRQRDDAEDSWRHFVSSTTEGLETSGQYIQYYQSQLDAANTKQAELQGQISQALSEINQAQASQDDENSRRADAHEAFNKAQKGLQEAIDAAKEAKLLLEEAGTHDLSLMQMSAKKAHKHFKDIKAALKHLKMNSEVVPMIEVLVEIASKGVNGAAIGQILELIDNLIQTLEEQLHSAVTRENADVEYSANAVATFQNTIDNLTNSVNEAQTALTQVEGEISQLGEVVKSWHDQHESLQKSLDDANAQWKSESDNWDALIARLKKDIKALNHAEDILSEQH